MGIESDIKDLESKVYDLQAFCIKLLNILKDSDIKVLHHTFYSDYSSLASNIIDELKKRKMDTTKEYKEDGTFKY